jgi:hypothetical protein
MRAKSVMMLLAATALAATFGLQSGCENSSDNSGGGGGDATGTYAGTFHGNVCGRGLTMTLNQNGLTLSGTYALTDPDFAEGLSGTVSSANPPATAVLHGGGDRRFEITFSSHQSFGGGFYKGATRVCDANGTR